MMGRDHISLQLTPDIKNICRFLLNASCINAFSYSFVARDGSRAELWSNRDALEHTFLKKRYISQMYTPNLFSQNERYIWLISKVEGYEQPMKELYLQQLIDQRTVFQHDHAFMIVQKNKMGCEYYIFYSAPSIQNAVNFYFNNLDLLESFITYFKSKAGKLIDRVKRDPVIKPWRNTEENHVQRYQPDYPLLHDKKILSDTFLPVSLSTREITVATMICQGFNIQHISKTLCISKRTVERHIENMRNKYQLQKKSDLISFFKHYPAIFIR